MIVLILWQFAHTISHFAISFFIVSFEIVLVCYMLKDFSPLTWSKSIQIGGKDLLQSIHGTFLTELTYFLNSITCCFLYLLWRRLYSSVPFCITYCITFVSIKPFALSTPLHLPFPPRPLETYPNKPLVLALWLVKVFK